MERREEKLIAWKFGRDRIHEGNFVPAMAKGKTSHRAKTKEGEWDDKEAYDLRQGKRVICMARKGTRDAQEEGGSFDSHIRGAKQQPRRSRKGNHMFRQRGKKNKRGSGCKWGSIRNPYHPREERTIIWCTTRGESKKDVINRQKEEKETEARRPNLNVNQLYRGDFSILKDILVEKRGSCHEGGGKSVSVCVWGLPALTKR